MSGDEIKIEKLERSLNTKWIGLGIILIIPTMKLNFAWLSFVGSHDRPIFSHPQSGISSAVALIMVTSWHVSVLSLVRDSVPPSDWPMMVATALSLTSHESHVSQSAPLQRFLTSLRYQWSPTFPCHQDPNQLTLMRITRNHQLDLDLLRSCAPLCRTLIRSSCGMCWAAEGKCGAMNHLT